MATINQIITSVEQTGGSIPFLVSDTPQLSDVQLLCSTLIVLMIIYVGYRMIDGAISRTCIGCKRLKNCEKRLAKLEGKKSA